MANVNNPDDIIVGTGRLYIDGKDVGQLQGEVGFNYNQTSHKVKAGYPATVVLSLHTEEEYSTSFNLLEANLAVIRSLLTQSLPINEAPGVSVSIEEKSLAAHTGRHTKLQNNDLVTLTIISTEGTETAAVGEIVPGATTEFTLTYKPKSIGAIYKNGGELVEGGAADYTINMATGVITLAVSATAGEITADYTTEEEVALTLNEDYFADMLAGTMYISSNAVYTPSYVDATYTYKTYSASGFGLGGAPSTNKTFLLEFVHKLRDGGYRVVKVWKGSVSGEFTISFQEQAESPVPVTVTALADSTKPAGMQFVTYVDTTTAPYGGW